MNHYFFSGSGEKSPNTPRCSALADVRFGRTRADFQWSRQKRIALLIPMLGLIGSIFGLGCPSPGGFHLNALTEGEQTNLEGLTRVLYVALYLGDVELAGEILDLTGGVTIVSETATRQKDFMQTRTIHTREELTAWLSSVAGDTGWMAQNAQMTCSETCCEFELPPFEPTLGGSLLAAVCFSDRSEKARANYVWVVQPERAEHGVQSAPVACQPVLGEDGIVRVDDKPVGIEIDTDTYYYSTPRIRVWPLQEMAVLVAEHPEWFVQGGATTSGKLWKVTCGAQPRASEFYSEESADFGNAALTRDGHYLYYSGAHGVGELDLKTRKTRRVTDPPMLLEECWYDGDYQVYNDVVVGLSTDERVLTILRGGPCGYESDWTGRELRIHLGAPLDTEPDIAQPIASVAVDADGRLWLGDAGRCQEPGIVDPQTLGAVWMSPDVGESWQKVAITQEDSEDDDWGVTAVAKVLTDIENPGHLAVLTQICEDQAYGPYGGEVALSWDGGATWLVPLNDEPIDFYYSDMLLVTDITSVDGSIEHLMIWVAGQNGWETQDGGRTWAVAQLPARNEKRVRAGGFVFFAKEDWLWRYRASDPGPEHVFPPCPSGKIRTANDHCCWAQQQWSLTRGRCTGKPSCPPAMMADGEVCVAPEALVEMPLVPAGTFRMGCSDELDDSCEEDEAPAAEVFLDGVYLDRTEVTVAAYRVCVEAGMCQTPATDENCNYGVPQHDDHPINCVNWEDARAYCHWIGKRLPTEAEWEKAARGGSEKNRSCVQEVSCFPWGAEIPTCRHAVLGTDEKGPCEYDKTRPVGSRELDSGPYGHLDLAGNVAEWVADWYDSEYYAIRPTRNPVGPAEPSDEVSRSVRGASFQDDYYEARTSNRQFDSTAYETIGFRCARSAP